VDALTVNPYLGVDGIKPFIDDCVKYNKGIFVLVKTSNKSSGEIQDILTQEGRSIYEIVAEYVESWGENKKGKIWIQLCGSSGWSNLSQSGQNFKKDSEKIPIYWFRAMELREEQPEM